MAAIYHKYFEKKPINQRLLSYSKRYIRRLVPRQICITQLKPNANNSLLLTFDDGPHPEITPQILKMLRRYGSKAVFFVVGKRIERAPHVLCRILDEGHWIGNHTYSHPNNRRMCYKEYVEDLKKCEHIIFENTGTRAKFHRPPLGQLTIASLFAPWRSGLITMNWSYDSKDWCIKSNSSVMEACIRVNKKVRPREIILFHDERPDTLGVLDILLPTFKLRGFNLSPKFDEIV